LAFSPQSFSYTVEEVCDAHESSTINRHPESIMNRILRINVVWLFIMSPLNAAVTAGYSGPTFNGSAGVGFNGRGQTFTASIGGTLTSISLILKGSDAGDATVGVHTVAAGLPSTLLGEVVIPATTIPPVVSPAFVTADFSGLGIELAVGTQYAISLMQGDIRSNRSIRRPGRSTVWELSAFLSWLIRCPSLARPCWEGWERCCCCGGGGDEFRFSLQWQELHPVG
jgi:hypothetical protein